MYVMGWFFLFCCLPGSLWLPASEQDLGTARWGRSGVWQSLKAREVSNTVGRGFCWGCCISQTQATPLSVLYLAWGGSQGTMVHVGKPNLELAIWSALGLPGRRCHNSMGLGPMAQPGSAWAYDVSLYCSWLPLAHKLTPSVSQLSWEVRVTKILNLESRLCILFR